MQRICVFCGSNSGNNPLFVDHSKKLGKIMAKEKIELVYGGAKIGLMGVISNEVIKNAGKVIGIIPKFLNKKEIINKDITKLHQVSSMHERKKKMYDMSDAFIALPGGIGTLEELSEIITWNQLKIKKTPIGILNINRYYDELIRQFNTMSKNKFIYSDTLKLFKVSDSPHQLMRDIMNIKELE